MRKRRTTLPIGEITSNWSTAAESLADALEALGPRKHKAMVARLRAMDEAWPSRSDDPTLYDDAMDYCLELLPYCCVMQSDRDNRIWIEPDYDSVLEGIADGIIIAADSVGSELGTYYVVSDHGNASLYYKSRNGRVRDIWA